MSSGFLPPKNGLWYLGEQCGKDEYMDMDSIKFLTVDIINLEKYFPDKYNFGYFHGWEMGKAEKYLLQMEDLCGCMK
jgi:hypothetical protein